MKKVKQFLISLVIIGLIVGAVSAYLAFQNWTIRFSSELDRFFGEGNWECTKEEENTSRMYTEYYRSRDALYSEEVPGHYKNWDIMFTKKNGEPEIWTITNHTWKINNDNYGFLSSKRYSAKQALILELMDVSQGLVCDELYSEMIQKKLSEQEAELQKCYGDHASFEIYFGKEQGEEHVEYVDGVKQ